MKAAVFYGPGDLRIEDVPDAVQPLGGALIEVHHVAICGSDVRTFRYGKSKVKPPIIIGHEICGRVVAAPDKNLIDKMVAVLPNYACGVCRPCRNGWETLCENLQVFGLSVNGGMAEFMAVPKDAYDVGIMFPLERGTDSAAASLGEPLSCVLSAQDLVNTNLGDKVLIHGSGPIGIMHAGVANKRGAEAVAMVEPSAYRRRQANSLIEGDVLDLDEVDGWIKAETGGWGVDVQILATSSPQAFAASIQYAALRGRISLFGGFSKDSGLIPIDGNLVHYRELTIVGASGGSRRHMELALRLIKEQSFPVGELITHRLSIDEIIRGIDLIESGDALRVIVDMK